MCQTFNAFCWGLEPLKRHGVAVIDNMIHSMAFAMTGYAEHKAVFKAHAPAAAAE